MEEKIIRNKLICNSVFVTYISLIMAYLLLFIIQKGDHSLILSIFSEQFIYFFNILIAIILFVMTFFVCRYNKIDLRKTIIPFSIGAFYTIYLLIYGFFISKESTNIVFSNIKSILVMALISFIVIFVIPKILTKKHVVRILVGIYILSIVSIMYFSCVSLSEVIKDFLNINNFFGLKSFYTNKNIFGLIMLAGMFCGTILSVITKKKCWFYMTLLIFPFSILTFTKTTIICGCIFYLIFIIKLISNVKKKWIKTIFWASFSCMSLFLVLFIFGAFRDFKMFVRLYEYLDAILVSMRTVSNRIDEVVKSVQGVNYFNVFFGVGFASGKGLIAQYTNEKYFHMSYHENLICGGIALTIIKFLLIVYLIHKINSIKSKNKEMHTIAMAMLVCFGIYSFSESVLFFDFSLLSIVFTFLLFALPLTYDLNGNLAEVSQNKEVNKIAFVTTIYPNKSKKWYGIYLHNLAQSIKKLGKEIEIIHIVNEKLDDEIYEGIKIKHIYHKQNFLHKFMIPVGSKFKFELKCLFQKEHYKSVIIHFYPIEMQNYIIDEAKESGANVIHYLHSRNIWERVEERHPLYRKLYQNIFFKKAYAKCSEIICVSNCVKHDFLKKIKHENVHVIYNGVDDMYINNSCKFVSKTNDFKLLSVGNLISIKGQRYVIKALKIFKEKYPSINFKYTIIGNGVEKDNLEKMISDYDLSDKVILYKAMPPFALLKYYNENDIFILPSYSEALGCVYLEALNCGLVTIGCMHQGIKELNKDNIILLVEEKSVEDIVNNLKYVIMNFNKCKEKTIVNKKCFKKYSWDYTAKELIKII